MSNQNEKEFTPVVNASETSVTEMFGKILQEKIQSGAVEKAITLRVDRMIDSCIDDAFSSYGDISKSIKKSLQAAIAPNLDDLGQFPTYHHFVMQSIKSAVTKFQDEKLQSVIDKEMAIIFEEMPKEITLTWLVDNVKESVRSDDDDFDGGELTLLINKSGSFTHVSIGKEDCMSEYSCEYRIGIHDGKIFSLKVNDKDCDKSLTVGKLYNFDKQLFNAYTMGSEFVFDKGTDSCDYDTEIESNNEWD